MKIFRILALLIFLLFFWNYLCAQELGTVSIKGDKIPVLTMKGLSDTLIWTGRVNIVFCDMDNFVVKETKLVDYMMLSKEGDRICGTMIPILNPCDEGFDLLYKDIDKKIRQFEFQKTKDGEILYGNRLSFLIHFLILPCSAPSGEKPK